MTSIFRSIVHASITRSIQSGSFVQQVLSNTWVFLDNIADFTFTRTGDQSGIDSNGDIVTSTTDNPAFIFGEGILLEGARTNLFLNSFVPATQTVTVTAVPHTLTVKGTGSITVSGVGAGTASEGSPLTLTPTAGGLICTVSGSLTHVNLEAASFGSSFIETTGSSATRSATSLTRAWPFPANGISGQIKVRPQFNDTDNKGGFVGTLALYNAASPGTDNLEILYSQTTGTIFLGKDLGSVHRETSVAVSYNSGDLLNIRFKADSSGLHLWVNALPKVSDTIGISPTNWTTLLDSISVGTRSPTFIPSNQTVESIRIWNTARSDDSLENLT